MSKNTQIILSVSILLITSVVLAGCSKEKTTNETTNKTTTQNQPQAAQEQVKEGQELAAAIESGKPTYCKISKTDGTQTMEYWIKDKKMKAVGLDVGMSEKSTQPGKGYVINDGTFVYIWSDTENVGMKMKVPTEQEAAQAEQAAQKYTEQMPDFKDETVVKKYEEDGYKVNCQATTVNDSEFIPPTNITFQDMEAVMQDAMKAVDNMNLDIKDNPELQKLMQESGN